ncbi:MAG TPA: hypothetical protein VHQ93_00400 [Chitinophagaceae bacterium]|jgi:hypothetical protein|nr:hypothetical protein [Chitinophagaceae bacterium]
MKLYKTKQGIVVENDNDFFLLRNAASDFFFNYNLNVNILLSVGCRQELWAYVLLITKQCWKKGESQDAGGGDLYD